MGAPEATAMMRADNRRLKGDLAKSRRMFGKTFTKIGGGIKKKLGGAFGGLGTLGVGIGVAAIGKDVLDFEKSLIRLGIQAKASGTELDAFRAGTIELSKATGISRSELIGASSALVALIGTAGLSQEKLKVLAKANLATGASMEDLAGVAFSLDKSFNLTNAKQLQDGLSAIIAIGNEGSIPLNQLTSVLRNTSASFAQLGGTGVQGAADLAAALQVISTSFGGPEQAGTGLEAFMGSLVLQSKALKKAGIDVFDKGGAFTGFRSVVEDFRKANLTIAETQNLLKSKESVKVANALISIKGTKEFSKFAKAGEKLNTLEVDSAKFRESSAGRLQASMNQLKETFAAVFTPERIEKFVQGMGKLAEFAGFVVDHAKEFALIWGSIKLAGFANQMAGISASMGTAAGGAGKLSGALGKASAAAAAFSAGFAVGTFIDEATGASDKISDFAAKKFGATKSFGENRFLRQTAREVIGDEKSGDTDPTKALNNARRLLTAAKQSGVLNEAGQTKRSAASAATFSSGDTGSSILNAFAPGIRRQQGSKEDAGRLIEAIEAAQRLVKESEAQRSKGIDVRVTVDDQGRILAAGKERAQGAE